MLHLSLSNFKFEKTDEETKEETQQRRKENRKLGVNNYNFHPTLSEEAPYKSKKPT
jgi:hypothetical protein